MQFTTVKRAINAVLLDGHDPDSVPEVSKVQGEVTFTPLMPSGDSVQVQTPEGPVTVVLAPVRVRISDGVVMHRGAMGVQLFAGGEGSNPTLIRWRASFSHLQAQGIPLSLRDVVFDAVPGGEVDLTSVAPLAGQPEPIVRGPQGTSIVKLTVEGGDLIVWGKSEAGVDRMSTVPLAELTREAAESAAVRAVSTVESKIGVARDAAVSSAGQARTDAESVAEARRVIDGYRESVVAAADGAGRDRAAAEVARAGAESAQADAVAQAKAAAGSATSAKSDADRAGTSAAAADSSALAASGSASTAKGEADRARQAADSAADTVASGSPDATTMTKGKVQLAGDLAGTADAPTVPALAAKADKTHTHTIAQVTGLDAALAGKAATSHTHTTTQVDGLDTALAGKAPTSHTHTTAQVQGLDNALATLRAQMVARPAFFFGPGSPPASIPGAAPGDVWWDTTTGNVHKITGV